MVETFDLRLILTIGVMIVSVDALQKDYESRLRKLDQRTDQQENMIGLGKEKVAILSTILSPSNLEFQHREIERVIGSVAAVDVTCKSNERRILKLESLHNGSHRPTK